MTNFLPVKLAIGFFVYVLICSSCAKDPCTQIYKIITPVYENLTAIRATVQSKSFQPMVNTGKIYISGKWIFLNEQQKGIHVIDNSNPTHPVKTGFINIPGNVDMSVKENILYADLYCDIAAINIEDPLHVSVKKFLTNLFPERGSYSSGTNADSIQVITSWIIKDTTASCRGNTCFDLTNRYYTTVASQSNSTATATGTAGSMARFAAVNDHLYAVNASSLHIIDIQEPAQPFFVQKKNIGWNIETIFPYNNKLYIGAGNSMSVYDLKNPADPQQLSWTGHWCSGDPVVADDNYAYVTLHAANICGSTVNQLEIYNLATPGNPALVTTYPMRHPQGLAKDGNLLFVCDEKDGLKIYDASNAAAIKLIKQFTGTETYDVIALNGIAYVVAKEGLFQYDYSNSQNIRLLSQLLKQ